VTLGQLTPRSVFVEAFGLACHELPVRVITVPLLPTAMHVELLGQLTLKRTEVVLEISRTHVTPLLVDIGAKSPTTTQSVRLQQLTPASVVSTWERGFA
jgi:hypothetical protein